MRIFANGCIEHRDLRTRAELVHLESFTNYHEPKIEYSSLLEAKEVKQRPKRDSRELVIIIQQDVPSVTKRSY